MLACGRCRSKRQRVYCPTGIAFILVKTRRTTTAINNSKLMPKHCIRVDRKIVIIMTAVMLVSLSGVMAHAGWLIDAGTFHVSAHGQMSCSECHTDINERSRHPDPS